MMDTLLGKISNPYEAEVFSKYQKHLVWIANTPLGRKWFDIQGKGKVVKIVPNGYHIFTGKQIKTARGLENVLIADLKSSPYISHKIMPFWLAMISKQGIIPIPKFLDSVQIYLALANRALFPTNISTDFISPTSDGYVESTDSVYATMRAGAGLTVNTAGTTFKIGQDFTPYFGDEAFTKFDTSSLAADATITSGTLKLYHTDKRNLSGGGYTCEARINDWGAALTTADWVPGADLSGKTLVATITYASITTGAVNSWTSEAAMITNISKTGTTYMVLCTDKLTNGTAPTSGDDTNMNSGDNASNKPTLTVVYTLPARAGFIFFAD